MVSSSGWGWADGISRGLRIEGSPRLRGDGSFSPTISEVKEMAPRLRGDGPSMGGGTQHRGISVSPISIG
jgi:hypothetical protein